MKLLFFALSLVVIPMQGSALTTAEYYALAPELVNTINNSWALIYTVSTGSFVAFYLFGWSAHWMIRIIGLVVFLVFLDEAVSGLASGVNTAFEAQLLLLTSTNVCSPEEAVSYIYKYAPLSSYCAGIADWEQLAVSDPAYHLVVKGIAEAYADLGLIGEGHSMASQVNFTIGNHIQFLFWRPANGIVCLLSVLVWVIVPSKQFFISRGWLSEN
mgnify:CR=1 FL=1